MQLPQRFAEKVGRVFGEKGRAWLAQVPQLLARCQARWQLTDLRVAPGLSHNLIGFAESPAHGAVVLKVGVPHPELFTEMKALALYGGRGICRLHEADRELGALLLERVEPGWDLTRVAPGEERFRIAADVMATLLTAAAEVEVGGHGGEGDQTGGGGRQQDGGGAQVGGGAPAEVGLADGGMLPFYSGWVERAFARVRAENRADPELQVLVDVAEGFIREIEALDRPRVLLHGDLHHQNILWDCRGTWKAIDPKGVLGVPLLEAARFMQNEFRMGDQADRLQRLDQMAAFFAARLGESPELLAKAAFVDRVLATCWSVEEGLAPAALREAVAECEALLGYCSRW